MPLLMLAVLAAGPTAVEWQGSLVASDGKSVHAWSMPALTPIATFDSKLTIEAVARDEKSLWAFSNGATFRWSGTGWDAMQTHAPTAPCDAYAVVDGAPVGVCGKVVHRFSDGATWPGPKYADQIRGEGFGGLHVVASHGTQLALGTGFGEWGGYFWLLDLKTGTWSKFYDELAYVNGIAWNGKSWSVAWAMSHMGASTRVREHDSKARVQREGTKLNDAYLRTVASSAAGVFAVEQQQLVRVTPKLEFETLRELSPKVLYDAEPDAVGVAAGIKSLIPVGADDAVLVTAKTVRLASGRVLLTTP